MVSFVKGECGPGSASKRRRAADASPSPAQHRTARHRKQKLVSKLSDSGFEEDLTCSPISPPAQADARQLGPGHPDQAAGPLPSWFLQYGEVGFEIQREREAQFHPCNSLARQPQVTAEARCKLLSWLIPVHRHFHLSFECCCLAVNIMDRFLASTPVAADCFQLLGITALLLASKQVEVYSPPVSHLLSLCCDAFTAEQFCNLECLILLRLNFRLAAPTLAFFLDYYTNCVEASQRVAENRCVGSCSSENPDLKRCSKLAQKVCELSLADYAFNKYPPSLTAGCALKLATELMSTQQGLAGYAPSQSHTQPIVAQLSRSSHLSGGDSLPAEGLLQSVGPEGFSQSLAQECTDKLRLLVSLNREALERMSAM
ncbi:cyclin-O [Pholidichthys leucotaenia]